MGPKQQTRSSKFTMLGSVKYSDVSCPLSVNPVTGSYRTQVPTGIDVLGRISHLTKQFESGKRIKVERASSIAATELHDLWIYGLNIYPLSVNAISVKILKSVEDKNKLLRYPMKQRVSESWITSCKEFNKSHQAGFDIRTNAKERIRNLVNEFGVKMTDEEERLHEDNCKLKSCSCDDNVIRKCSQCPRQVFVSAKICERWKKCQERKEKIQQGQVKLMRVAELEKKNHVLVNTDEALQNLNNECIEQNTESKARTNDTNESKTDLNNQILPQFPYLPLRNGRKSLNSNLMLAFTHILATYKVSESDLEGICVDIANMVFGQKWIKSSDNEYNEDDSDYESDEELSKMKIVKPSVHKTQALHETQQPPKKKRRVRKDLTYVFPSRQTRRKWLKDGSLLNLRHVANKVMGKDDNQIITFGFDDTKKSAGHHLYDVKTNNITINSPSMHRQTYTTGYLENISHTGKDQAVSINHTLQLLSVLANKTGNVEDKLTVDDIKENIDFWMCDRSGDGSVALDQLEIKEDKRIKCCAHTILCIDESIDTYIASIEAAVGRDKLIGASIGLKAVQSKSSIVTLGLIELCKGLSPSHAILPYSLYMRYKQWRTENNLEAKSFKGFQSNRFGRTSQMAELFLKHKADLITFFNEVVDEKSNLLIQAMDTYIKSDWFELGCTIYSAFNGEIIQPLCDILGIDESSKIYPEDRNWSGVRRFYVEKLQKLDDMSKITSNMCNKDKLIARCSLKIKENLQSQLNQMDFLKENADQTISNPKLTFAPLTNSGCESKFAQLDVKLKVCGGAASLDTISDKQIVSYNKYLLTIKESAEKEFKWARTSDQAKSALALQKEFLNLVQITKSLAMESKRQAKEKLNQTILKLLALCQQHGGPITENNIQIMDHLSEKQLISEVSYLKKVLNANIKLKTRVKDPENNKWKFIPQTVQELKNSIRSVVKPDKEACPDMNCLLDGVLKTT